MIDPIASIETVISELREKMKEATPLPWSSDEMDFDNRPIADVGHMEIFSESSRYSRAESKYDAWLIVAAVNAIPRLFDEIELLKSKRDAVMRVAASHPIPSTERWVEILLGLSLGDDNDRPKFVAYDECYGLSRRDCVKLAKQLTRTFKVEDDITFSGEDMMPLSADDK